MIEISLILIFVFAYLCISFEHLLKIDKAAPALLAAAVSWCILGISSGEHAMESLSEHTAEIAGIIFFLMGAMTIVEVIDCRGGFVSLKRIFVGHGYRTLTWMIGGISFLLSAVLDNLTTAIVMTSVIVKLVESNRARMILAGLVIIAANAGGAWSPIGDVTTTMLWVGDRVSTGGIISRLILPSILLAVVAILLINQLLKKEEAPTSAVIEEHETGNLSVLILGISLLLVVPLLKTFFHVPPFVAMIASLGVLWIVSDFQSRKADSEELRPVAHALKNIDLSSAMFFLGILLTVSALDSAGILRTVAGSIDQNIPDERIVAGIIGMVSAVVDNVPLVAGAIGMYDPVHYSRDHQFWIYLAFCAGTGGSMLVIGSAAGVAAMGIAKLEFGWYARVIGPIALVAYVVGIAALVFQEYLISL